MFAIGDLIVYGNTGVCEVTDIVTLDSKVIDNKQPYYVLKPLSHESVIYSPVNNTKVMMRPIISKEEAERLIDMIPSIHAEAYHNRTSRDLWEHYESIMKNFSCADLIELTMSIYAKKIESEQQNRKFGSIDQRFMKQAEDLLFDELGAALNIPKEEVPQYIASKVDHRMPIH